MWFFKPLYMVIKNHSGKRPNTIIAQAVQKLLSFKALKAKKTEMYSSSFQQIQSFIAVQNQSFIASERLVLLQ